MAEVALKDLSVDSSVRVLEKLREKWVSDQVTHFEYAKQKGMEKGMEERSRTVALNMLKSGLDTSLICKVTGLSVDEIKKLKSSFN